MIKKQLKRIGSKIPGQPFVQRIVDIGVVIKRCPRLIYRLYVFAAKDLAEVRRSSSAMNVFRAEQLPALLQTISEINNKLLNTVGPDENMVKSLPVALRSNARELADIRKQLDVAMKSIDSLSRSLECQREGSSYNAEQVLGPKRSKGHQPDEVVALKF